MDVIRLYKFISERYAEDNLLKRQLKVSKVSELNDLFEMDFLYFEDLVEQNAFERSKKKLWNDKGIISMSESWSNPLMWGTYASDCKGIAIGFDVPRDNAQRVSYRNSRVMVRRFTGLGEKRRADVVMRNCVTKFSHWSYEREWRLFVKIDPALSTEPKWFMPFSDELAPREVLLGARCAVSPSVLSKLAGPDVAISLTCPSKTKFEMDRLSA